MCSTLYVCYYYKYLGVNNTYQTDNDQPWKCILSSMHQPI